MTRGDASLWVGALSALAVIAGVGWQEAWRRHEFAKERRASCPHPKIYFTSLFDQLRPREFTRHCESCGWQTPWMDNYPPAGSLVKLRKGVEFTWRKRASDSS